MMKNSVSNENKSGHLNKYDKNIYKKLKNIRKDKFLYYIFMIGFIQILIFKYYPLTWLVMAFKNYKILKGVSGSPWVGFSNFIDFFQSPDLLLLLNNTITINVLSLLFSFPMPIILALLLNEVHNSKFKRSVQTITYLPHFLSSVIVVSIVMEFLSSRGPVNTIRLQLGQESILFMTDPNYFRTIFISAGIWQGVGWGSIIYLAALSGIDIQLYEAAIVDGAGKIRQLIHISLPSIIPLITVMLILRIGNLINLDFERVFLFSNSATRSVSQIISTYVYAKGVQQGNYSFATAVGLFNSVISFVLVYSANLLSKRLNQEGLW